MDIRRALGISGSGIAPLETSPVPVAVGVEVELEQVRLTDERPAGWTVHEDGSLRNNGLEFVFARPTAGDPALAAIATLRSMISDATTSPRTSVHIHTDMSWSTVEHAQALVGLVYLIENGLFAYANEDRKWCGYAMALDTMPEDRLQMLFSSNMNLVARAFINGRHEERYYGLNTRALGKYGTLEWRYFPGTYNTLQLQEWTKLVSQLVYNSRALTLDAVLNAANRGPGRVRALLQSLLNEELFEAISPYMTDENLAPNIAALDILRGLCDETALRQESIVFYSGVLAKHLERAYPKEAIESTLAYLKRVKCITYSEFRQRLRDGDYGGMPETYSDPYDGDDDEDEDEDEAEDEEFTMRLEPIETPVESEARVTATQWPPGSAPEHTSSSVSWTAIGRNAAASAHNAARRSNTAHLDFEAGSAEARRRMYETFENYYRLARQNNGNNNGEQT